MGGVKGSGVLKAPGAFRGFMEFGGARALGV